jgi:hypothetical protein
MAYPFIQYPTFNELIGRLTSTEFNCTLETMDLPMTDKYGEGHSIHYLRRVIDNLEYTYVLHICDIEDRLTPSLLRSIIARLKLDPKAFGLVLD